MKIKEYAALQGWPRRLSKELFNKKTLTRLKPRHLLGALGNGFALIVIEDLWEEIIKAFLSEDSLSRSRRQARILPIDIPDGRACG